MRVCAYTSKRAAKQKSVKSVRLNLKRQNKKHTTNCQLLIETISKQKTPTRRSKGSHGRRRSFDIGMIKKGRVFDQISYYEGRQCLGPFAVVVERRRVVRRLLLLLLLLLFGAWLSPNQVALWRFLMAISTSATAAVTASSGSTTTSSSSGCGRNQRL